jgi:hypothetical protein
MAGHCTDTLRKPANMAEKQMLAFHFIFSKRYFPIYQGISEDFTLAAFLTPPEQVKKINTRNSEIVVKQLRDTPNLNQHYGL